MRFKYQIKNFIQKGGYGTVYKALDKNGQEIVIKFIYPGEGKREISVYRKLQTLSDYSSFPYLSKIKTSGELSFFSEPILYRRIRKDFPSNNFYKDIPFIVINYLDGQNLYSYINSNRKLSTDEVCTFVTQMLVTIDFLHSHHMAHGDIKLENIIYLPNEKKYVLIDYGFMTWKNTDLVTNDVQLHHPGSLNDIKKYGYFHLDTLMKNDIYAFGISLYQIFHHGSYPPNTKIGLGTSDTNLNAIYGLLTSSYDLGIKNILSKWQKMFD